MFYILEYLLIEAVLIYYSNFTMTLPSKTGFSPEQQENWLSHEIPLAIYCLGKGRA